MSDLSIITCSITLLVSLVLPVGFSIGYGLKHRGQGIPSAWILGALGFVVTQMCIRLPILQAIGGIPGFRSWAVGHYVLYTFCLALTAGLFEFAGRFAVAKLLERKGLTYPRSLAAGLGHGGIEAMLLVGMTMVNNLILMVMLKNGGFDGLLAQTAAAGGDTVSLLAAKDLLVQTPPWLYLLSGLERLLAMTAHAAMSLLVCWGVHTKRPWKPFLLCLVIHTCIDFSTVFSAMAAPEVGKLSQAGAYGIIYSILIVIAMLSLFIIRSIHRRWKEETEADHVEKQ